ncbi:AAA family ATPase [Fontivita pretiosa]|uniref:AAA family ATPase n=1 Tax=Fontivita pretiosa TaxID=2989684 RepID=UPI003D166452
MSTSTLNESILTDARRRRSEGQSLKAIAADVGVTWQRLDKALRHGLARNAEPEAQTTARLAVAGARAALLVEKYRPARLDQLFGQERVVSFLRCFLANPYPCAMLFEGETGTGKTSAALALAAELGCAVDQQELGGVWTIASGEQSADAVRDTCQQTWHTPMFGSGWKLVIVNEADRMSTAAETIWLDRLESLPRRTVVVFTTNHADRLSERFRDRCIRVGFESDARRLHRSARALLSAMWKSETQTAPDARFIDSIVRQAVEDGHLSFRRAVQILQRHLMARSQP